MAIENQKFGKGITLAGGFDLGAKAPLDSRGTVATIEERDAHVTGNRVYEGMLVFVEADKKTYQYVNNAWVEFGSNAANLESEIVNDLTTGGENKILSAEQGKVLKGLIDAEAERAAGVEQDLSAAIDGIQGDLDVLETLVGSLPEGTSAKDIVDYVNIKTSGISTDAALSELQGQLNGVQGEVATIKGDYLKSTDKTALQEQITANAEGIDAVRELIPEDLESLGFYAQDTEPVDAKPGVLWLDTSVEVMPSAEGVSF